MIKTIVIVGVVLIAGVLIFAATKPDIFRVQRAASIKAPPEKIFALINDFHRWEAWSPWEKKDPALKSRDERQGRRVCVGRQQGRRPGTHGDRGVVSPVESHDQARFREAVRSPQYLLVHAGAQRRHHECHLGDAGRHAVLWENHPRVYQHGQYGRQGLRGRSFQPEGRC